MPKRKLPNTIYVYAETESGTTYLIPNYTLNEAAEPNEKRIVGVYTLKETHVVTMQAVVKPPSPRSRRTTRRRLT